MAQNNYNSKMLAVLDAVNDLKYCEHILKMAIDYMGYDNNEDYAIRSQLLVECFQERFSRKIEDLQNAANELREFNQDDRKPMELTLSGNELNLSQFDLKITA